MKKLLFIVVMMMLCTPMVMAKEKQSDNAVTPSKEWRKGYLNLAYSQTKLSSVADQELQSNFGGSLAYGRSFYLHKPIIKESLRFAIDVTWMDINYHNFTRMAKGSKDTEPKSYQQHQTDFALHVGPSINIGLGKRFKLIGYFRYCPTFTTYYDMSSEDIYGYYATMFVGGGTISYAWFGLGAEARFGNTTYKALTKNAAMDAWPTDMSGCRAFISFKL